MSSENEQFEKWWNKDGGMKTSWVQNSNKARAELAWEARTPELAAMQEGIREMETAIAVKDKALRAALSLITDDGRQGGKDWTIKCINKALTTSPKSGKGIVETLKWYGDEENYKRGLKPKHGEHFNLLDVIPSVIDEDKGAKAREIVKGLGV